MSDADRVRWDARYAVGSDSGVPQPPDALRGREHLLPRSGRALDVACGRGTVAVWLAARGLTVDAVDVSGTAVELGAALERATLPQAGAGRVRWWRHDLDAGLPGACAGPYEVVVCQRFRDPGRYPALVDRLASGGLLVITVLSRVGEGPGEFRAAPGELLAAFGGLDVLHHREGDGEASLVGRRSAAPSTAPQAPMITAPVTRSGLPASRGSRRPQPGP